MRAARTLDRSFVFFAAIAGSAFRTLLDLWWPSF